MNKPTYIHYGSEHFNKNSFKSVQNRISTYMIMPWTKPLGGFWASRSDAKYGWRNWCVTNDYYNPDAMPYMVFTLKDSAKIYTINSIKDLDWLVEYGLADKHLSSSVYRIDFEKIANRYDAIEVNISNNYEILYYALYGWDCDSILIMNPDIIEEI